MRVAKSGSWWIENPQRALANNSVCYTEKPDIGIFMKEWLALYDSKSGERGIFSRDAAKKHIRKNVPSRDPNHDWGCNPCSEILLRPAQCCNLREVVIRSDDTYDSLIKKVKIATILGTLQATLTDLRYVRPIWKKNMEEERLLGVSLTGIMDSKFFSTNNYDLQEGLRSLKEHARTINEEWANRLGINVSTAITCIKPSGTVSQLVNSASGIHPRFSHHYIRTVRVDKRDPIYNFLKSEGVPVEDELLHPDSTAVFSFPVKSPDTSVLVKDRNAIEQLELWKVYAEHWCEHKPSITVYVKENEWLEVGAWCYKNFDILSGVSFLPYSGHTYEQAPYQEITEESYQQAVDKFPREIHWERLKDFESEDTTSIQPELACSAGGSCDI
jgi:ribonucleoside-diphosphate reductase alpha chain